MGKVIIIQNETGGVSIIHVNESHHVSIEMVASRDVPTGKPYKIIDKSEIPSDRTFRDAWEVDESELTDGVGA